MRVVGTAGHVDHGKSTLVRVLTGIDPDRLKEEKARGMTIDLGFAWMDLPLTTGHTLSIGLVDVPGHIDFIKNMLAGVGGIDAALLVIAADEGVMPQTREHLGILDLLAVPALVVALTKVDAAPDAEWLDLVELDVTDLLAQTRFAAAPVVRVSALHGTGLDDLRRALADALAQLPPRRDRGLPRLPVDRVFTLSGFGTVVTGTLADGALAVGDNVEVLPTGLAARIRGMQIHRQPVTHVAPGSRVALNLTGVSADEVRRGDVVVKPGTVRPSSVVDVEFRLLPDAARPLRHNQAVDFFIGASETTARVRVLGVEELAPGETGWLQLRLARPVVAGAGDRFILRQPSPGATLGGGRVVNPHPQRRWRRFDAAVLARLAALAQGTPEEILLQTLDRQPFATAAQLVAASGLDAQVAAEAVGTLADRQAWVSLGGGSDAALLSRGHWTRVLADLTTILVEYHRANPLRRGMARSAVRSRLASMGPRGEMPVRLFNAVVAVAQEAGAVAGDEGALWLPDFAVRLTAAQEARVAQTLARLASAGVNLPTPEEVMGWLGQEVALLEMLLEQGSLLRVGGGLLLRRADFEAMAAQARAAILAQGPLTLAQARDLWGTSRKIAQAVLEEMDAQRVTRRVGDARVLREG